jgi:hypothetical protein
MYPNTSPRVQKDRPDTKTRNKKQIGVATGVAPNGRVDKCRRSNSAVARKRNAEAQVQTKVGNSRARTIAENTFRSNGPNDQRAGGGRS